MNINKIIHDKLFALRRKNKIQKREVTILHLDFDLKILGLEIIGKTPSGDYSLEVDVEIQPKKNYLDLRREYTLIEKKDKKAPVKQDRKKGQYKPLSEEKKQKQREYRQKNKEKINEINRTSYHKNKEQRNQHQREYYQKHKEKQNQRDKERYWRKKNEKDSKGKSPND